jgi:hypothetical protein
MVDRMKNLYTIVGMKHRKGASGIMAAMKAGEPLTLRRDINNEHDRFAVQVWCRNVHVAFIKGNEVQPLAVAMDASNELMRPATLVYDGTRWPLAEVEDD